MPDEPRLQTLIEEAALRFAHEIIDTLRAATVNDMIALSGDKPAPRRRGRPPKARVEVAAPEVVVEPPAVEPAPEAAPKKKRTWPKCSAEGCDANMYGPSGQAKLCYAHHREAGGGPSPFAKDAKPTAKPKPKAKAAPVKPESALDPEVEAPKAEATPPKKRAWPTCTAEGCDKNVYMPSGAAKLCYQHHVERGGKLSPLVGHNEAKSGNK